jgi:hypothetical protein
MLIDRGDGLRVAGVIHGAKAALCASPTEVVSVRAHREWLEVATSNGSTGGRGNAEVVLGALVAGVVLIASARWRRERPT